LKTFGVLRFIVIDCAPGEAADALVADCAALNARGGSYQKNREG
jgi:hypothetical protein